VSLILRLPPNFQFIRERRRAGFFIPFVKDNCDRFPPPGRPVYQLERMGDFPSVVVERRNFVERRMAKRPMAAAPLHQAPDC
jgi:hypothetical protein